MIGMMTELNMLAKNKPGACLEEKIAEIMDMIYMEAINTIPITAAICFTFFMLCPFLIDIYTMIWILFKTINSETNAEYAIIIQNPF